ncbi:MAG: glycogen debranching enzyme, partial [Eubacterium sp.]|nr:glycogen debranching enzyme [Eubacterium sp.]
QETYPGDSFSIRGCVAPNDYSWEGDKPLEIPMRDLVIYEAHVRGFTKDPSSGVNYKGTYSGLIKKIPYLKELGINCIELLPVFEFDELENTHTYEGKTLYNYWGYSTVNFYSPKEGYARSALNDLASEEFKYLIKKMHQAGIEVILDVVFNHTAEGNELGPTISFRGIDNRTYYLLSPEGEYLNYSGCGNTINCNNAVTRGFIRNCLRYWVAEYHIDGFRFDLAAILSRDTEGNPMVNPPLLESLAQDVILGKCKLIAEAWDAAGLYQVGRFPAWHRWAEWNGRYRDCLRGFLKSGAECGPELIQRIQGSPDLYSTRGSDASVNFITCHDGFTLCDLVSYNEKHNEANGEGNQDGSNDNISWNCGVEGETDDPEIISLRKRQIKNAAALLLLSRGVPMLLAGDEFMNTQYGNNNAYCQDNEISWLNWDNLTEHADIFAFFKKMIAFRHAHPVLRRNDYHMGQNLSGYPELSFHGTRPWDMDTESPFLCFGFLYAEPAAEFGTEQDTFIYCAVNAFWEEKEFGLPLIPQGKEWEIVAYTGDPEDRRAGERVPDKVVLMPRSLMVLVGR